MPKLSQFVDVTVADDGEGSGKRKLTISIEASRDLFMLSDLLAREGAIKNIEQSLKHSTRKAVAEYLSSGREFLRSVNNRKKGHEGVAVD